jgi:UPF0176 protein
MTHFITAFFHFMPLTNLPGIRKELEEKAEALGIEGLLILGPEGINSTCSAASEARLAEFKNWIKVRFDCPAIRFKDSKSDRAPFRRYKVKIRDEICTTGIPGLVPPEGKNRHLTPEEWDEVIRNEKDAILIDTRNWYEYRIGTFKGALNPNIEKFTDFPDYIEQQGIRKEQKMLIFCTGGIRCEKGILDLEKSGYSNVYQLEGGILNYLEKRPEGLFEGECFVFDQRVAVDRDLAPTKRYSLCPHCGQPGEQVLTCVRCDHEARICPECLPHPVRGKTCSKNCAHMWEIHPGRKGTRQKPVFSRNGE